MLAETLQFYGMAWTDLMDLPVSWFCILYRQIEVVEARRLLGWLPVITYPHLMTRKDRDDIYKKLARRAGYTSARMRDTRPETIAQGWARLARVSANKPTNGAKKEAGHADRD